jgi:flavocytochrome c
MNKLTSLSLAVSLALFISPAIQAKDGVYTSSEVGRNGEIKVQVTVKDNKIADVKVDDWSETHPVADLTKTALMPNIVKNQSVNVDNIAGATLSSFAIKAAVRDCLKQAGLDVKQFSKVPPKPALHTETKTENADVVIIGAGGAGLSAAVTAAKNGKKVIIVEKNGFAGGNTSVSGGCFNVANVNQDHMTMTEGQKKIVEGILAEKPLNPLHQELLTKLKGQWDAYIASKSEKLFDSPELHALQSWKSGDRKANLELVYTLTQNVKPMMEELSSIGFEWRPKANQFVGALWPRSNRASNFKSGVGYVDTFLAYIKDKNLPVEFHLSTKADDLIIKGGRVVGVKAQSTDGTKYVLNAKNGVVIATGGFGANVKMRNDYDELWNKKLGKTTPTTNLPSATGDGITLATKAGAGLTQMGWIQLFPAGDPTTGATSFKLGENSCIYVNKNGKRYVNESERRDVLAKANLAQEGGVFYVISSAKRALVDKDGRNAYGVKVADILKSGKSYKADTLEELAQKAGINGKNLVETVKKWNEFCKTGKGDEMGRPTCMDDHRLDEGGPYYATLMTPSVHHTMGGVVINSKAQVLTKDGKVIPGLYAAGEVTGGIHGTNRVGCNAVPDALVFGRIAALNLSK